ncbi:MAG TPA: DUF4831 family protein [Candidatus Polarisedimenticolaceae bacterium]|nr:DUF4831 family protein [Candidatus Polarisedimenticolaceae bacterium]
MRQSRILLVLSLFAMVACAKVLVLPVTSATKPEGSGVYYALPQTLIRVKLKVDRTVLTPAPFQDFAAIFAPGGAIACDGCKEKRTKYSIQEPATLGTLGVPDPTNIYLVQFVGGRAMDQTLSMTWNEAGLASNAAASVTNKTGDAVLASVKAATGLAIKASGYGATRGAPPDASPPSSCPVCSEKDSLVLPILSADELEEQSRLLIENWCDIEQATRNTKEIDTDALKKAVSAYASRLLDLVASHAELLRGKTQSFEPVALAAKVEAQIDNQLRALYLGRKETTTWEATLNVPADTARTVFELEPTNGICPLPEFLAPDSATMPSAWKSSNPCTEFVKLTLEYEPKKEDQLFWAVQNNTKAAPEPSSFRYRIPAQMKATLTGKSVYAAALLNVAQLGCVATLPAKRNSKGLGYDLAFIEATGGLKSFKLSSTGGLEPATIDSSAAIAGSILDARAKEAAKDDELTLLKQEAELLELKKKICDAQKALNLPCRFSE